MKLIHLFYLKSISSSSSSSTWSSSHLNYYIKYSNGIAFIEKTDFYTRLISNKRKKPLNKKIKEKILQRSTAVDILSIRIPLRMVYGITHTFSFTYALIQSRFFLYFKRGINKKKFIFAFKRDSHIHTHISYVCENYNENYLQDALLLALKHFHNTRLNFNAVLLFFSPALYLCCCLSWLTYLMRSTTCSEFNFTSFFFCIFFFIINFIYIFSPGLKRYIWYEEWTKRKKRKSEPEPIQPTEKWATRIIKFESWKLWLISSFYVLYIMHHQNTYKKVNTYI
jgi:hypothetical protein